MWLPSWKTDDFFFFFCCGLECMTNPQRVQQYRGCSVCAAPNKQPHSIPLSLFSGTLLLPRSAKVSH